MNLETRFNVQCCPTSSQKEYVPIELQLLETKNPEAQTTPKKSSPHNSDFSQLWCGRAFLCTPPTFRTSRQAPPTNPTASRQPTASVKMKLNISYPANGSQKLVEIEDERKLRDFMEKRVRCCCSPSNFFPTILGHCFQSRAHPPPTCPAAYLSASQRFNPSRILRYSGQNVFEILHSPQKLLQEVEQIRRWGSFQKSIG
jgi:hypothetical protein